MRRLTVCVSTKPGDKNSPSPSSTTSTPSLSNPYFPRTSSSLVTSTSLSAHSILPPRTPSTALLTYSISSSDSDCTIDPMYTCVREEVDIFPRPEDVFRSDSRMITRSLLPAVDFTSATGFNHTMHLARQLLLSSSSQQAWRRSDKPIEWEISSWHDHIPLPYTGGRSEPQQRHHVQQQRRKVLDSPFTSVYPLSSRSILLVVVMIQE